jgi:hypothetical protein
MKPTRCFVGIEESIPVPCSTIETEKYICVFERGGGQNAALLRQIDRASQHLLYCTLEEYGQVNVLECCDIADDRPVIGQVP